MRCIHHDVIICDMCSNTISFGDASCTQNMKWILHYHSIRSDMRLMYVSITQVLFSGWWDLTNMFWHCCTIHTEGQMKWKWGHFLKIHQSPGTNNRSKIRPSANFLSKIKWIKSRVVVIYRLVFITCWMTRRKSSIFKSSQHIEFGLFPFKRKRKCYIFSLMFDRV